MKHPRPRLCALAASFVLTLASTASAQTPPPATQSAAEAGLNALRARMIDAYKGGDVKALLPYLDPEIVIVFPDGEMLRGRDALVDYASRKGSIVERYTNAPEILHRDLRGDTALTYGLMHDHYVLKDGRGEFDLGSRFTVTAGRVPSGPAETDGWVIRSFHQSPDAFDNPVLKGAARQSFTYGLLGGGVAGLILGGLVAWVLRGRRVGSR